MALTTTVNTRSQAVMERIGMTRDLDADFDHPSLPEGSPLRRHVLYRIGASRTPIAWRRERERGADALRLGRERSLDDRVPRHRVGRAGARRRHPLRVPGLSRARRPGSAGRRSSSGARATARPSPASTPPRSPASRRRGWRSCWVTRASSATGPRSSPRCATPAPSGRPEGVRLLRRLRLGLRGWPDAGPQMAPHGAGPRRVPRVGGVQRRPPAARLQLRRADRLLRPPAGHRAGQRPPGRLLPLRRAHRGRPHQDPGAEAGHDGLLGRQAVRT